MSYYGDGRVQDTGHTAADSDWSPHDTGLVRWFLRLGAPIFAAPLAKFFHQSLVTGVVPHQWKTAVITPIPKIVTPARPSDFRPISITPVLSRSLERIVVRKYIYPAVLQSYPVLNFSDQFAFRPSGSTTAAIVAMLHTVRSMLTDNDYVHVFAFDFSKAFDTVKHASLMHKLAQLAIPDNTGESTFSATTPIAASRPMPE